MICDGCKGEVFRARWVADKWFCKRCDPGMDVNSNVPGSLFPFTTKNFDGHKTEVQSLRHLRKLEAQHGMHSVAFNTNSKNFDLPPRGR